jgi:hypothetical protein
MRRLARRTKAAEGDPLISVLALVAMLIPMLLYGVVFVKFKTLDVRAPRTDGPPHVEPDRELRLTVFITDQGFHFKVNPEFRLPWMTQAVDCAGPDIPRTDDGWDFDELAARLKQIKSDHARERRITLGAEDDIDFDILIRAMDHARGSDEDQLFPEVTLTRGVV